MVPAAVIPESGDNAQKASGRRAWSLRVYLVGLVMLLVAGAAVNLVYQRSAAADDARDTATADAQFGATIAARDISQALALAQSTVVSTAATPGLAQVFAAPSACTLNFGGAGSFASGHLDVVGLDGKVGCTSLATSASPGYAKASWLAAAAKTPQLLGPIVDDRTGKQVIVASAPVDGQGAVVVFLDLDALGPALTANYGGPRSLEFVVTAPDGGVVFSRSIDADRWTGTATTGTPFAGASGGGEHRDLDGTSRFYGQATVADQQWHVFAGANKADALADANRLSNRQLAITLVALAAILIAAFVIHRRIARPIRQLSAGVRASSAALASAPPLAVEGPAEVVGLVDDFNALIAAARREELERTRAEAERRELEHRLRQSERLESLGHLAGGIAHDFNNLLGVIMNYAAFVGEETEDRPAVRADVEQIQLAAERAERLTRQLLIFGRRDAIRSETIDLNAIVADIQNLLARTIGEHIELVVDAAPNVPAIRADQGQLEQVLVNLAVNARDAMPDGGTLTIETKTIELDESYAHQHPGTQAGGHVELSVSDTGTGMSSEVVEHIFEPFFTTKPKGAGSGLGLATVYGIVTEAGGSMSVYSEVGIGTTFRIFFPAIDAEVTTPASAAEPPRGNGETILVVEDDPAVLELTARILGHNGYQVLEAATYDDAIALAAAHDFELLLTDSVMPEVSGKTLAERIDELKPGRTVLYMSGYSAGVIGPLELVHDDAELIQKPFSQQALLEKVHFVLHGSPG